MGPLIIAEAFLEEFKRKLSRVQDLSQAVIADRSVGIIPNTYQAWTNAIINLILKWGAYKRFKTYPTKLIYNVNTGENSREDEEYIFDAVWYAEEEEERRWWEVSTIELRYNYGCVLCLESEWGGGESVSPKNRFGEMIYDFGKLAEVKADLKVFLGAYVPEKTIYRRREMLEEFIRATELYSRSHRWAYPGEQYLIMLWPVSPQMPSWKDRDKFKSKIIKPFS